MTVLSTVARNSYTGDGVTTIFSFPNYILNMADLGVVLVDTLGNETPQFLSANYTVQGAGNQGGCSITMNIAPPLNYTLTVFRTPLLVQDLDLQDNDPLPAEDLEASLDQAMMIAQRLSDRMDRAMVLPDGDPAAAMILPPLNLRALQFLGFDANGLPIGLQAVSGGTEASAYIQSLFPAGDAPTARALLGFTGGNGNQIPAGLIPNGTITAAMLVDAINKSSVSAVKTTTYAILTSDSLIQIDPTTPFTATLPTAVGAGGKEYEIVHVGAGICTGTIGTTSSQSLKERGATTTSTTLDTPGESIRVKSDGANWVICSRHIPSYITSYVPAFSGLGTPSAESALWQRIGNSVRLTILATTGVTTTNGAQVTLPGGLSTASISTFVVGRWVTGAIGATSGVMLAPASAYLTFGMQGASNAGLTPANGSTILGNGVAFAIDALVPMAGWKG